MLGSAKPRRLDQPVAVSLEDLVPRDNFSRHLESTLDPIVFFKLQLIVFFEGIRSEWKLIETASLHLAHRWYLGYALNEDLPGHSSLTRTRQWLGIGIFESFFERIVDLCQEAGLVWGRELFFDATKVRANADLDSLVPRFYAEATAHLAGLFGDDPTAAGPVDPLEDELRWLPTREDDADRLPAEVQAPRWKLLEERRLDPHRPTVGSYRRTSDFRVSTTDPHATPMRAGTGTFLGYHDHYLADGGKARLILAALVTPADEMENVPMRDLLRRVCFRHKLRPGQVTGDTTYRMTENIVALEDAGIRAFFPLPDFDRRTPFYGRSNFTYDAERDAYCCPRGQQLPCRKAKYTQEVLVYRAEAAVCNACPVKAACTVSDRGRIVHRSFYAEYLDKVRAFHATEAYQKSMRKKKVWVEPLFAEAKVWHGLRRFRLRGLDNLNIEGLLVAASQNFKRWLAASGWGRRHASSRSLLALSGWSRQLVAIYR